MADFTNIKSTINAQVKQNGTGAITGNILNGVLNGIVDAVNDKKSDPVSISQNTGTDEYAKIAVGNVDSGVRFATKGTTLPIKEKILNYIEPEGITKNLGFLTYFSLAHIDSYYYESWNVAVNKGDLIIISGRSFDNSLPAAFLYDSNNQGIILLGGSRSYENVLVEMPKDGTLYVNGVIGGVTISIKKGFLPAGESVVSAIEERLKIYNPLDLDVQRGLVRASNRSIYDDGNNGKYCIINVHRGEKYKVSCRTINAAYPAAFLGYDDASGTKRQTSILVGQDGQIYEDRVITIGYDGLLFLNTRIVGGTALRAAKLVDVQLYDKRETDNQPTEGSTHLVTSGGVFDALKDKLNVSDTDFEMKNISIKTLAPVPTKGYVRYSDGGISGLGSDSNFYHSDLIPVEEGQILNCNLDSTSTVACIAAYNSSKSYVKSASIENDFVGIYTIPSGVSYIRICVWASRWDSNDAVFSSYTLSGKGTFVGIRKELNDLDASLESVEDKVVICCDGDSLTWGHLGQSGQTDLGQAEHNFPAVLQNLLGERYKVFNFGVPGVPSPTIVGNATGYRVNSDFTIPASGESAFFDCSMLKSIDGINSWTFTPVLSHETMGGINPCWINGIKGSLSYGSDSGRYRVKFTREVAGDAVNVKSGTLIQSSEMLLKNADHIIFLGANGGWKMTGDTDIQSETNINEFIAQCDNIINNSNDLYIVISYCQWFVENGSSPVTPWAGEAVCAEKYGNHYFNLRKYLSTDVIDDAIEKGYLPDDGTYPTAADIANMSLGKPAVSIRAADGVHFNDVGYHCIGDKLYEIYCQIYKDKIIGE